MFEDTLSGFVIGLLIGGLFLSIVVNLFLYFALPNLVMDIIEQYIPGGKGRGGKRPVEGLTGLTQNPVIKTVLGALTPGSGGPSATQSSPSHGNPVSYLKR